MEQYAERWQALKDALKKRFGKIPHMEALLFLIGVQEVGQSTAAGFSKEEKQDLIHVAVCTLLMNRGYYRLARKDAEGWPHFEPTERLPAMTLTEQARMLREEAILYFEKQGLI
ncbi:hypothetical protein [Compostibacter hankyongensis]|uniref:Uncharacterized protein n=1 Tax=Compostibacter hankyongensis TaxID=1007089 RepID=A0ABP8FEV2_9BACT